VLFITNGTIYQQSASNGSKVLSYTPLLPPIAAPFLIDTYGNDADNLAPIAISGKLLYQQSTSSLVAKILVPYPKVL
jgi:hypothetical protein